MLVNIDVIYRAVNNHHKISFHYWDYSPSKKRTLRHDGEAYVASPYALIWDDDRYYAPSYSDKHQKIINYRIDRMCDVEELDEVAVSAPNFNVAEHSRKMIKMYDGDLEETSITLRCENELMRNVIDRFGEKVKTKIIDKGHFEACVKVAPSSTFFGWVVQYQGGILIAGPESVKTTYAELMQRIFRKQAEETPVEV